MTDRSFPGRTARRVGAVAALCMLAPFGGGEAEARVCGPTWVAGNVTADARVYAVAPLPNGGVVAGGDFVTVGGNTPANRVAIWNGSTWSAMGLGITRTLGGGDVWSIAPHPSGDIFVAGAFDRAGGAPAANIARWDGSAWHTLGSGLTVNGSGGGFALAVMLNGDLVVGGMFQAAGGNTAAARIARWDGSSWSPLGTGIAGSTSVVRALAVLPGGELVAAGSFEFAGGVAARNIARWNGSTWSPLGAGCNSFVNALLVLPNGDLIAGGDFTEAGGVPANRIARWNGLSWSPLGEGIGPDGFNPVRALTLAGNGDVIVGGRFSTAGGMPAAGIARWNGSAWSTLGSGVADGTGGATFVDGLARLTNGDIIAGGTFTTAGGLSSPYMARWIDSGAPLVVSGPSPQTIDEGQTLVLSAVPACGLEDVSVQWQRNGVNIADGPGGASPGGGVVSGASATLPSPTDCDTPIVLTITGARASDSGEYTAVFTNSCGSAATAPALVTVVGAPCPADWNEDGVVDSIDISAFLADWLSSVTNSTLVADFNEDGQVNSADISAFLTAWLIAATDGC